MEIDKEKVDEITLALLISLTAMIPHQTANCDSSCLLISVAITMWF